MAKAQRTAGSRARKTPPQAAPPAKPRARPTNAVTPAADGWATDLMFDVREPKLAVSLRLDADVLRFFRAFGAGYQTRINEVLKAFMRARERAGLPPGAEGAGRSGGGARKQGRTGAARRGARKQAD